MPDDDPVGGLTVAVIAVVAVFAVVIVAIIVLGYVWVEPYLDR